jgi:hypothetical protein
VVLEPLRAPGARTGLPTGCGACRAAYGRGTTTPTLETSLSTDPLDPGFATLLVLLGEDVSLATSSLLLPGGEAEVDVDDDGDVLVDVVAGDVTADELLRAVLRSPALHVGGELLTAVVACDDGHEAHVMSGDLRHRYRSTRRFTDRDGPHVALVGFAPFADASGRLDPRERDQLRAALGLATASAGGLPSVLDVVNVLTLVTEAREELRGRPDDRTSDAGATASALAEADLAVAAWGAVPQSGEWAVDEVIGLLREARESGTRVVVPGRDGASLVAGDPPQPVDLVTARKGLELVDAPLDWLHGAPLA